MRFSTNYKIINSAIADFASVEKVMKGYAGRLSKVKSATGMTGIPDSLSSRIGSRAVAVSAVSAQATGIKKCFQNIGTIYLNGEKEVYRKMSENRSLKKARIVSSGSIIRIATRSAAAKSKAPWRSIISVGFVVGKVVTPKVWPQINWDRFRTLWESIKERFRNRPVITAKDLEKAADQRMKNEVQALLGKYENAWRKATTDKEREKLLNEFLADIQKVKGTSAKTKINFKSLRAEPGYVAYGSYHPWTKRITLNKDLLSKPEGITLFTTLIHEVRHAYQYEAVKSNKHTVSAETRQTWKENQKNYIKPKPDYDAYYNQPIERDARAFAGQRV